MRSQQGAFFDSLLPRYRFLFKHELGGQTIDEGMRVKKSPHAFANAQAWGPSQAEGTNAYGAQATTTSLLKLPTSILPLTYTAE